MTDLTDLIRAALDRRGPLFETLAAEGTTAVRLFLGAAEGRPGLTVDAYGAHALIQTFRDPLAEGEQAAIETAVERPTVWRHRGRPPATPPTSIDDRTETKTAPAPRNYSASRSERHWLCDCLPPKTDHPKNSPDVHIAPPPL